MEDQWLTWAKRLQNIASTGVHFGNGEYDKERYSEIANIANAMLSLLGNVPVSRIHSLVPDFAVGYSTPKVDVRGAVFRDDRILLVQEVSDRLWSLPGGYADAGLSAKENVEKEIWEEASLRVRATALFGVRHKAKHDYDPDIHEFYKLFFLCEQTNDSQPKTGLETRKVGWFRWDDLPPLSTSRVLKDDIIAAFEFRIDTRKLANFD